MDTSREYIEMSKALPDEMISAWEPNAGDFVFAKHGFSDHDYRKESDNGVLGIITKVQEDTFSIKPCGKGAVAWYSIKHSIPLWKQDQLQDMIPNAHDVVDWDFYHFANDGLSEYLDIFKTMEQLWLAFVMSEKYGKVWNSDKKEWI